MNRVKERDIIRRGFAFRTAVLCLLAAGLLTGRCSKSSNPSSSSSSISGSATLEQSTGHAGITVRLYHPPEFDPDLTEQQDQHPGVGLPITPRILFDHRGASFAASTETGADGSYAFSGVAEGEYIVVAEMAGYGHQARFDISVQKGRDTAVDPGTDDAGPDTGTDPFADPPDEGYPPSCHDDPTVCCSDPPVECEGSWQCISGHCMWVGADGGSSHHIACDAHGDCECYTAPVRCLGHWECLGGTCWYFCD